MNFEISEYDNKVSELYRWKQHWHIWEFLILRHNNNNKPKNKTKKFLNPLLILNKKSIRFIKDESYNYAEVMFRNSDGQCWQDYESEGTNESKFK